MHPEHSNNRAGPEGYSNFSLPLEITGYRSKFSRLRIDVILDGVATSLSSNEDLQIVWTTLHTIVLQK